MAAQIQVRNVLWALMLCSFCLFTDETFSEKVDLVEVDKSERLMQLFVQGRLVRTYDIALGASPKGHKVKEGDERTPEGRYILDYKKDNSSYYRAMHISYPNAIDKQSAKEQGVSPGGFIMDLIAGAGCIRLLSYLIGLMGVLL